MPLIVQSVPTRAPAPPFGVDVIGAKANVYSGSTAGPVVATGSHVASDGANCVVGFAAVNLVGVGDTMAASTLTATYGDQTMTPLAGYQFYGASNNYIWMTPFILLKPVGESVPGGNQTMQATLTFPATATTAELNFETVSYFSVASYGSPKYGPVNTNSSALAMTTSGVTTAFLVPQMFIAIGSGITLSAYNRTQLLSVPAVNQQQLPYIVGQASGVANPNFTATLSAARYYGGLALPLSPT